MTRRTFALVAMAASGWLVAAFITGLSDDARAQTGAAPPAHGQELYEIKCAACHRTGLLGAPKLGSAPDWTARMAQGLDTLVKHAVEGYKAMPPRGGNPSMSDADVEAVVRYMLAEVGSAAPGGPSAPATTTETAPPATTASSSPVVTAPTPAPARASARATQSGVNAFNRLMKPPSKRNPPPPEDGIHDPANEGTHILQAPRESFAPLPKSRSGNRVDWVKALEDGKIAPRFELSDTGKSPVIMDLNIVREVKGSMPDVVYPHRQHTEWLDCSNCHPAIFVPQKGANQMSMTGILLGQQCGVCHGKVAFPVSECRRCHSRNKPKAAGQ